jgi:hypothetical protein
MSDQKSSPPRRKLTPKQELFIIEYAKDFNATQAAIRAGYTGKCINRTASQLLAKTRHIIEQRQQVVQRAAGAVEESKKPPVSAIATLEQSLRMVTALAFHDPRTLYNEWGQRKDMSKLTRRQALCVVDVGAETDMYRTVDRAPYLNMLLKWHRAFPGSKDAPPPPPGPAFNAANWDEKDWEAFKRLYQKSQRSNTVIDGQPSGT